MRSRRALGLWGGAGPRGCLEFKGMLLRTDLMVLEVGPCASRGSCAYLKGRILTVDFLLITTTAMSKNQPAFLCFFPVCLPAPVERVPPKKRKKPLPLFSTPCVQSWDRKVVF